MRIVAVEAVAVVIVALTVVSSTHADIYLVRDRWGVLHFTSVPTDKGYQVMMRDAPSSGGRTNGSSTDRSRAFDHIIAEVAGRYHMDRALVRAIINVESNFRPRAASRGRRGLMGLTRKTALQHGVRNVYDPAENVEGGVRHLRMLLDRYGGNVPLAIAAYNVGSKAVDDAGGIPRTAEARDYVWSVLQFRQQYLQQYIGQAIAGRATDVGGMSRSSGDVANIGSPSDNAPACPTSALRVRPCIALGLPFGGWFSLKLAEFCPWAE